MDKVIPFLIQHGYTVLFIWVFAETMGLPIPCVPLLITIGALAGAGQMNLFLGIGIGVFAAFLGDIFWYIMGRRLGGKVLSQVCRISLEPDSCVRRTENIFVRFGPRALLVTKFFPGLSAVSTPLAGTIGMRVPRFLLLDGMGILLWIGTYVLLGYLFSKELDRVLDYALGMGRTLLLFVVGALSIYILQRYAMRRRFLQQLSVARITPEELKRKLDAGENVIVIDIRHSLDFEADPAIIPGALRIPFERIEAQPPDIPTNREIVVYCT
jgi:membrane protein DedA with SNARE-associated domain